ncbi:unnamed protein product, partial [Gulo gulo]
MPLLNIRIQKGVKLLHSQFLSYSLRTTLSPTNLCNLATLRQQKGLNRYIMN